MENFTKKNLTYTYNWNSVSLLTFNDNDFIDTTNGNDVLAFMSHYAQIHNINSIDAFNRLEYIIHNYAPQNTNSQLAITAAITKNWNKQLYRVIE